MVDIDRSVIEVAFSEARGPVFEGRSAEEAPAAAPVAGERSVAGRLAVVTGASGLLGTAVAAELVARGAHVCLIGRDLDALRATAEHVGGGAPPALLRCDLASVDDVIAATEFIDRIGAPVDVLVHAAGVRAPSTIARGTVEDLDEHYLLDVRGPYLLTQRLLTSLTDARGRVVFFAADDGTPAAGDDVHRTISQAGLRALADVLRDEAGPLGVRVLTVRTDDDLDPDGGGDAARFLDVCAAAVLDVLAVDAVDVTQVHLRRAAHRARSERR